MAKKKIYGKLRVDDETEYKGDLMSIFENVLDKYGLWEEANIRIRRPRQ